MSSLQHIHVPDLDITIYINSRKLEWGVTNENDPSGVRWKLDEINHINVLELKTAFVRVQKYSMGKNCKHVRVMTDNITAISYVISKGGIMSNYVHCLCTLWIRFFVWKVIYQGSLIFIKVSRIIFTVCLV